MFDLVIWLNCVIGVLLLILQHQLRKNGDI